MDDLRRVPLTSDRISGGLQLSAEAGWNQIEDDWRFMLGSGSGFGYTDADDRLVASGLTVEFGRFGWISMILVTTKQRRRGLATQLMRNCIEALTAQGIAPALDASPEGREVYKHLGFRDVAYSTRLAGTIRREVQGYGIDVVPLGSADLPEIIAFDTKSSGTDRAKLLHHLWQRHPSAAHVARRKGRIAGFVLARPGRLSTQIGPLVAAEEDLAIALLARAGSAIDGQVCLDLFDQHVGVRRWLDQRKFGPVTRFIRMVLSKRDIFPQNHKIYIIAGPELG
jgi:GNAT superfamily N-acetyltransferase